MTRTIRGLKNIKVQPLIWIQVLRIKIGKYFTVEKKFEFLKSKIAIYLS
jgi:hypothetical protein